MFKIEQRHEFLIAGIIIFGLLTWMFAERATAQEHAWVTKVPIVCTDRASAIVHLQSKGQKPIAMGLDDDREIALELWIDDGGENFTFLVTSAEKGHSCFGAHGIEWVDLQGEIVGPLY